MEKSLLASIRCCPQKPWVAAAESARTRISWRTWFGIVAFFVTDSGTPRAGTEQIAWSRSSMWSSASFAPAFPGRSMAASGSEVVSHHTPNGWKPKPLLVGGGGVLFL